MSPRPQQGTAFTDVPRRGTWANGAASDCPNSSATNCVNILWPGWRTTAWHAEVKERDIRTWWGGLVDGMRDASGQMYMRNRYYDPAPGQFTQQDPIGLAGGLNSYGFAAGDPVTYSDPYGLCPGCAKNRFNQALEADGHYTSRDDAARAGMIAAHRPSVQRSIAHLYGTEFGGEIIETPGMGADGESTFHYTGPRTDGAEASFTPDVRVAGFAGDYHSHGARSFGRYDDEHFSRGDINGINATGQPGYLVTPSGRMLKYDPDTTRNPSRTVEQIGTVPQRPSKP